MFGAPLEALPHPLGDHFETVSGSVRDGRYDDDPLLGICLSWSVWVLPRQVTPRRNHSCGNRVFAHQNIRSTGDNIYVTLLTG